MSRFGQHRYRPEGDWVQTTYLEKVAGVQFQKSAALSFCKAVRRAEGEDDPYGILLEPDPTNPHDRFAIRVIGFANVSGWLGKKVKTWHVGYVESETAKEIHEDILSVGVEISAELHSIYQSEAGFVDINYLILAPKGYSVKKRMKNR